MLEFESYERSGTNGAQFAKLNLRNTTGKPIWLLGEDYPPRRGFLKRPVTAQPLSTNNTGPIYSIRLGSIFMSGEKVPPGKDLEVRSNPDQGYRNLAHR